MPISPDTLASVRDHALRGDLIAARGVLERLLHARLLQVCRDHDASPPERFLAAVSAAADDLIHVGLAVEDALHAAPGALPPAEVPRA